MADNQTHLFTSESVTEGHPDKIADQISDAVLDAVLAADPTGRVACEVLVTTGTCIVAGEITTQYILRYVPDAAASDSDRVFRNINVKVSLPDVKVRARKGYYPFTP